MSLQNQYTESLPVVVFNNCLPDLNESEIAAVYMARKAAVPFTDWTDEDEWKDRISNDGTPPEGSSFSGKDLIRFFNVIGDMPIWSENTLEISGGRKQITRKQRVINFTIDETTSANYEFLRVIELLSGIVIRLWFMTKGGVLYGGNSGILVTINIKPSLNRGSGELESFVGVASWNAAQSPDRIFTESFGNILTPEIPDQPEPPLAPGEPYTVTYRAVGGEFTITNALLQNCSILGMTRGGTGVEDILLAPLVPTYNQVVHNPDVGTVTFDENTPLVANEFVRIICKANTV